jgi:radical SAM superfamily enzyme YgiQ (UPF0313 family)
MKITLINPPSPYLANDASYPPSGLLYLGASIEALGHEVEVCDLTGGVDWRKIVPNLEADVYGITLVTPNFNIVKELAQTLPKDKPIMIGGSHPTHLPMDTLRNIRCDAVVMGEGEVVIKRVMNDLEKGCLKKMYEGGIVSVSGIPKPARHLVDLHRYRPGGEDATPIYTSRGCPYNCAFCSRITGQTYRALPIPRVIEEVEDCISLGFKHIVFGDDNIIIQPDRVRKLLKTLPRGIEFRLNQDARTMEDDVVELAADAGCTEISYGIESGSQKMLDAMNKRTTVEANKRAIEVTKKHGVAAKAYFIVNFPGEDEQTIKETIDFAAETMPDKWLLSNFAPLPGCNVFSFPDKYGVTWISRNWEDYYLVGKDGRFKPCFTTEELTMERQIYLHDLLYDGLKSLLG